MICSYLHGVNRARLALLINLLGALMALAFGPPLIELYGLVGACLTLLAANIAGSLPPYTCKNG